jgi:hypothetical protein
MYGGLNNRSHVNFNENDHLFTRSVG